MTRLRDEIAALLRAGATYQQVEDQVGGCTSTIASVRKEFGIPVPPRSKLARPAEVTYALYATPHEDGHVRWTGPWAGRMPQITLAKGKAVSALRIAFLLHYRRPPEGRVHRECGDLLCVAGAHLADRRHRTLCAAVFGTAPGGRDA
ncbi:hypothetical protein ACFQ61_10220 [Streptomyces sp. NPDC056500]|uniref:hypothetical protein n=1 Tax=Streptomyces sp. NPDC056500 TaxID=3345840 RepID=UPI0036966136